MNRLRWKCLNYFARVYKMLFFAKIVEKFKKLILSKQFRNYLIGGGSAFIIDFLILNLLVYVLNFRAEIFGFILVANVISTGTSIIYSFYFQRNISFSSGEKRSNSQFLKFIGTHAFNLLVFNTIFFGILLQIGIIIPIAKITINFFQIFSSFFLYKFFVFRKYS